MIRDDAEEAFAILGRMLDALGASAPSQTGRPGADLRRGIGDLRVDGLALIEDAAIGAPLLNCFTLALAAGASLAGMDSVRVAMLAEVPKSLAAVAMVQAGIRYALAQEGRILVVTTFASRSEIDVVIAAMNTAFDPAETTAADDHDGDAYRLLISLHAAISRHLSDVARPLPRLVAYDVGSRLPALTLSQRIYAEATREGELVLENKAVHPLFMPVSGVALSN